MADQSAARRARMACRIYLKLYDVGPAGAPITKADVLGPRDDQDASLEDAMAVISRFMDDTVLDEPGHQGGVPHYALTAGMRDRMEQELWKPMRLAEQIREALARADAGDEPHPADLLRLEAIIRTGYTHAEPL